jgi:hypothetical protein
LGVNDPLLSHSNQNPGHAPDQWAHDELNV